MRFQLMCAVVMAFALVTMPGQAADWGLKLAEDANGKVLTSLSITKPFWVILTNNTDHDLALPRYDRLDAQCMDIDLLFTTAQKKEILVGIGSFSETWNLVHPEVVGPKQAFLIKVDFAVGNWVRTKELEGFMVVKVIYENRMSYPSSKSALTQGKPLPWIGKVESEPILVTIVR